MRDITEEDLIYGFRKATCGMSQGVYRWHERAIRGLTDDELATALAYELGIMGGSASPGGLSIDYVGVGLRIWINREVTNTHTTLPTFQGKATLAMARRVYGIPNPADPQLSLF